MILTIDIGNTTINLCGIEKKNENYNIVFYKKTDTAKGRDCSFFVDKIGTELRDEGTDFEGAVLASVVPDLVSPVCSAIEALIGKKPFVLTAQGNFGLKADVKNINRVGMDRLVDSALAAQLYPLPVITVDMGTATTFNVIDEGSIFRGGVIAPGLETSLNALSRRASQLPDLELCTPEKTIGKDTEECMLSGAVIGSAAMLDGIVSKIESELGKPATLVITGGLAHFVLPYLNHKYIYDPELLPKGLALLYELNNPE